MSVIGHLQMDNIGKSFAGVPALKGVHFDIRGGEIHALLGANGAGKSTLMKILSGAYTADSGQIIIDGKPVRVQSPLDAKSYGIHCIYQEVDTALVPGLTVAENIMMDKLATGRVKGLVRWGKLFKEAEAVLARLGAQIPVRKTVEELSLAEKQLVLIARLLTEQARFVIFDEPTAPLSLEEAERLFRVMEQLKRDGIGSVFISHRLPEVFELCDRITVMRDGENVLNAQADRTDMDQVIRAMLGKTLEEEYVKHEAAIGSIVLEAKDVRRGHHVRGVSLDVKSGEIVAVVGLVGAGKTELSRLLFGADKLDHGTVKVHSRSVPLKNPADAVENGIVLVPEERRKQGILVEESVQRNLSLPLLRGLSRLGFIQFRQESELAVNVISRLGIKTASPLLPTMLLSGGNQQKVSIGKWVETKADVYLFDEPTKGVDIGAKTDIFRIIGELAGQGKAIVYFTCEFAEALGIADRIIVMYDGQLVKQFARGEATQEQLLYYASGGKEKR
ncbi:sugar ABC transporter ATP-binding protein [Paenibacillus sp. GCM10012307]|uniref:Sugar ABC transporter ATP-binding protein n=1 Tax=Paenibacillus roseus TaxID=2798579 RepID=A0A934MSR3_9BACL|nr:sugar ABC transporter ATP-binding protein [Paenibacillus roseus]MBJ6363519.1 sugar ABC transporter ATP-binding protein [Paenibacillus roseus]